MPENTHNKQSPCSVWIWGLLILGLILLFLLYSRATSEKAQEIQQDIQTRTSQNLLGSEHASAVIATTDGRDVTLKGVVDNQQAMMTAEKIARQTAGVRQVNNQISVSKQEASANSSGIASTLAFSSGRGANSSGMGSSLALEIVSETGGFALASCLLSEI